jgi:glycosyltransferase involved in cell wall biosynthesis
VIEQLNETLAPRPTAKAVSVVVPAFNEAEHIAEEMKVLDAAMQKTGWEYELLIIDDGSVDGTAAAASAAGFRVLQRGQNRGYGAALKAGTRNAKYDWILITDADGTYPVESIPELLALTEKNDMVVGARIGNTVKIPLIRRPAKAFLRWLASYLAERPLPDINSGMRVMHRNLIEKYEHLLPDGFSFTTTITLATACNKHPVVYHPIDYHARLGNSKIRARHAIDFTLLILRIIIVFNPLRVFVPLGFFLGVVGGAKFAYDVFRDNLSESAVLGLLGATLAWSVGMLADQHARLSNRKVNVWQDRAGT